jgi:hypothetical protein
MSMFSDCSCTDCSGSIALTAIEYAVMASFGEIKAPGTRRHRHVRSVAACMAKGKASRKAKRKRPWASHVSFLLRHHPSRSSAECAAKHTAMSIKIRFRAALTNRGSRMNINTKFTKSTCSTSLLHAEAFHSRCVLLSLDNIFLSPCGCDSS